MPAPKNRHGRRGSKAPTPKDGSRRYGTARLVEATCPEGCGVGIAADDQEQLDAAIQDHLDNAHTSGEEDAE